MSAGVALVAAGTGLSLYGNYKANMDRASAEDQNAAYFEEQARYAEQVGKRKLELLQNDQDRFNQRQHASFAGAGISFDGSALDVTTSTKLQQFEERTALETQTAADVRLARLKADQARSAADQYRDPVTNILTGLGTAATGAARFF